MGATTSIMSENYFKKLANAKANAQKRYKNGKINWNKTNSHWTSGDLGYCMFTIWSIKTED